MNRILLYLVWILLLIIIPFSCYYQDFRVDYPYSSVYFANQFIKRSFVEDETNTIKVGVMLGGKRTNIDGEKVFFSLDNKSGLSETPYIPLPEKYYTLSNNQEFIIEPGSFIGEISMDIHSDFYMDPLAHQNYYALLFRLESTTADSILCNKDSLLLILSFESGYFGNYYHNGRVIRKDTDLDSIIDTIIYRQEEPVTNNVNIWTLSTAGSKTVYSRGIANYAPSDLTGFYIKIYDPDSLDIIADSALIAQGYDWKIKLDVGDNYYDPVARRFYLNYSFQDVQTGYKCYASDTLIFRNRILDGVNQWDF